MKVNQLLCNHEYEICGRKSPVKCRYKGKDTLGTTFYLECIKCGRKRQRTIPTVDGDLI